jgi:hypothetical protein
MGSTFGGAFPSMPVLLSGFDEAYSQCTPFDSFDMLLLLESHQKLKQTGTKSMCGNSCSGNH